MKIRYIYYENTQYMMIIFFLTELFKKKLVKLPNVVENKRANVLNLFFCRNV